MEEATEVVEQPTEEVTEQPTEAVVEETVEQHEEVADPQEQAPQTDEPVETEAPAEVQTEAPVETPEEEQFEVPNHPQVRPLTQEDLQLNPETGDVNVDALLNTFNERIAEAVEVSTQKSVTEVELKNKYEKSWSEAETSYPELKDDKSLRDMVYAVHVDSVERGKKYLSPKAAAEKLLALRDKAKTEGIQAAQESSKVQDSARLETSSQQAPTTTDSDLEARLNSPDRSTSEAARREKLSQLIKANKI